MYLILLYHTKSIMKIMEIMKISTTLQPKGVSMDFL